jgi:hypothetical protein
MKLLHADGIRLMAHYRMYQMMHSMLASASTQVDFMAFMNPVHVCSCSTPTETIVLVVLHTILQFQNPRTCFVTFQSWLCYLKGPCAAPVVTATADSSGATAAAAAAAAAAPEHRRFAPQQHTTGDL